MTTESDNSRLVRIEEKVDLVHKALIDIARIEERQVNQQEEGRRTGKRLEVIEGRVDKLEISRAKTAGIITGLSFVGYIVGPHVSKLFGGG